MESYVIDEDIKQLEFEIQRKQTTLEQVKRRRIQFRRQHCEPISDDVFRHVLRQLWLKKEGPAQVAKLQLLNSTVPSQFVKVFVRRAIAYS